MKYTLRSVIIILTVIMIYGISFAESSDPQNNVVLELTQIKRIGKNVECNFQITNFGKDKNLQLVVNKIKIVSAKGYEYQASVARIGMDQNSGYAVINKEFASGIMYNGTVVFKNNSYLIEKISLLEFNISDVRTSENFKVQFRDLNIPYPDSYPNYNNHGISGKNELSNDVVMTLEKAQRQNKMIEYNFTIDNKGLDTVLTLKIGECRFIDTKGQEFRADRAEIGSLRGGTNNKISYQFPSQTKVILYLYFQSQKILDVEHIKLIEVRFDDNDFHYWDIPITVEK